MREAHQDLQPYDFIIFRAKLDACVQDLNEFIEVKKLFMHQSLAFLTLVPGGEKRRTRVVVRNVS